MHPRRSLGLGILGGLLITLFSIGLFIARADGKEETFKRLSLRGLQELDVDMEALTPEAEEDGLTRNQLLSDVEKQLGGAEIKVSEREDADATLKRPYLYINVSLTKERGMFLLPSSYFIYLAVSLYQNVLLEHNPREKIVAITWQDGSIGGCRAKVLESHVREKLRDLVEKFLTDYKVENPE
jgi:hypothetical protein